MPAAILPVEVGRQFHQRVLPGWQAEFESSMMPAMAATMNMLVTTFGASGGCHLSARAIARYCPPQLVGRVSVSDRTWPWVIIFCSDMEERPSCADHVKSAAERHHAKKGRSSTALGMQMGTRGGAT